jgi:hypothetical protein
LKEKKAMPAVVGVDGACEQYERIRVEDNPARPTVLRVGVSDGVDAPKYVAGEVLEWTGP